MSQFRFQSIEVTDFFDKKGLPFSVYKFRDWTNAHHKLLLEGKFYFPSPLEFNDPFDCRIPVAFELLRNNPTLQVSYFTKFIDEQDLPWSKLKKEEEVKRLISEGKFNNDVWLDEVSENYKRHYDANGIFCLSKNKTNILLWSHYAKSHQGICVGFNARELFKIMLNTHLVGGGDVTYVEDYPLISPLASYEEKFIKPLTFKSHSWKYEEEIRLFKLNSAKKIFDIPLSVINEITIGCNISEPHKKEIINYVKDNLPHIKLYQATILRGKFELKFQEIIFN